MVCSRFQTLRSLVTKVLKRDRHGLEGTSWASLQSTGTDGSRIAFYTVYERVATKYDNDLVGGHNKNLNVVLATVRPYPSLSQLI